jgi:hypothetical protein
LGCHGEYVENSDEMRPALERANAAVQAGKSAVVNMITLSLWERAGVRASLLSSTHCYA